MTEATITTRIETNDPTKEDVVLTVTDGETYVSKKFAVVQGAHATVNQDFGEVTIPLSVAVSGGTVTIHCTGLTDQKVLLTCVGRK